MNCETGSRFAGLLKHFMESGESVAIFSLCVEPFVGRIVDVQSDYLTLRKCDSDEDGNTKFSLLHVQLATVGGIEITEQVIQNKEKTNENSNSF